MKFANLLSKLGNFTRNRMCTMNSYTCSKIFYYLGLLYRIKIFYYSFIRKLHTSQKQLSIVVNRQKLILRELRIYYINSRISCDHK